MRVARPPRSAARSAPGPSEPRRRRAGLLDRAVQLRRSASHRGIDRMLMFRSSADVPNECGSRSETAPHRNVSTESERRLRFGMAAPVRNGGIEPDCGWCTATAGPCLTRSLSAREVSRPAPDARGCHRQLDLGGPATSSTHGRRHLELDPDPRAPLARPSPPRARPEAVANPPPAEVTPRQTVRIVGSRLTCGTRHAAGRSPYCRCSSARHPNTDPTQRREACSHDRFPAPQECAAHR